MEKYKVYWEERRSVIVDADSSEEAIEKVMSGDYEMQAEASGEITAPAEAFKIKQK
jgi:hypothetical protein